LAIKPVRAHFNVISCLIDLFPIPSVLSFIADFPFCPEDHLLGNSIVSLIHALYTKSPDFWSYFSCDFLLSLLTVESLSVLNPALDLFLSMADRKIPVDFAMAILETIFGAMPVHYHSRQISTSSHIMEKMLKTQSISTDLLRDSFLGRFPLIDPEGPAILNIILSGDYSHFADSCRPHFDSLLVKMREV
jgi:hypothetical protein